MARKEPRKGQSTYGGQYIGPGVRQGVIYPPVDRNLAPLYMSCPKERTQLGYRTLGLDQGPIGEDVPGEVEGQTDQATQIPSWNSSVA